MGGAGFKGIMKLVTRRQNIVAQYIAMRPNLDLYAVVGAGEHRLGGGKEADNGGSDGIEVVVRVGVGVGVGVGVRVGVGVGVGVGVRFRVRL